MKKTLSITLAALLAGAAAPALAQSGPTWTGGYIGVYGGAQQQNDQDDEVLRFDRNLDGQYNEQVTTSAPANAFSPGFCGDTANTPVAADGCSSDKTGVEGGIRAGYDWQFGNFVIGGVADISATSVEDSVTGFSTTPANYVFKRKLDYLAGLRARVGYAMGDTLVYGTGGGAYGKLSNSFFSSNTANSFTETVNDDEAKGWQAGGGIEHRLAPNLSVTGEYLYTSLEVGDYNIRVGQGTAPATNPFVLAPNTAGTDMIRSNSRFGSHAFRIGMNYRF